MNVHLFALSALATLTILAACSGGPEPTPAQPERPTVAPVATATTAPSPTPPPGSTATPTPVVAPPKAGSTATTPGDTIGAERTVRDYFQWRSEGREAEAQTLLTPEYQAKSPAPTGPQPGFRITAIESQQVGANRIAFRVQIDVTANGGNLGDWSAGANTRFIEVVRTAQGWRINDITSSPPQSSAARLPAAGSGGEFVVSETTSDRLSAVAPVLRHLPASSAFLS